MRKRFRRCIALRRRACTLSLSCGGLARCVRECAGLAAGFGCAAWLGDFWSTAGFSCLGTAGRPKLYLGSADWMHRNIYERVEVMFHIRDEELCKQVFGEVIEPYLADTEKTRILLADGRYVRAGEAGSALHLRNGFRFNTQEFLIGLAEGRETIGAVPRPPSFLKLTRPDKSISSV